LLEVEKVMGLLAFEDQQKSPFAPLLEPTQRQATASELNSAILSFQNQEKGIIANFNQLDAKLALLLKTMLWSQAQLEEKAKFPKLTVQGTFEDEKTQPTIPIASNNNSSQPFVNL
jgi:hypothetical protein